MQMFSSLRDFLEVGKFANHERVSEILVRMIVLYSG